MFIPTLLLLVGTIGVGVWYGFADLATTGRTFVDVCAYPAAVFGAVRHLEAAHSRRPHGSTISIASARRLLALRSPRSICGADGSGTVAGALMAAGEAGMRPIRRLHTGRSATTRGAHARGWAAEALMTLTFR